MVGIFAGAVIGWVVARPASGVMPVVVAVLAAAILNAASNALNQIFDLEIDRLNKPCRPLPSGILGSRQAWAFSILAYSVALALAALVNRQTFVIYLIAALATVAYSTPPLRLKCRSWASNLAIAFVRGELLKVAGWAAVATVLNSFEPWYIGLIYFTFLFGATATKDFADIEGDRKSGCITLPVRYGAAGAARIIAPFFMIPWAIMALGVFLKILSGEAWAILTLSLVLLLWGIRVLHLMNRDPGGLARQGENHPSWKHMYWMMMAGHLGLAAAYLLRLVS